jgi:hypothetical protein
MKLIRLLKRVRVALLNLDDVLAAYYLRPELETKVRKHEGILADFNLKRELFLQHGDSEILTSKEQILNFFESVAVLDTNFELIRVGAKNDGGYLVPDDLENVSTLFSPGVAAVSEFELEFASRGIPCFLADASVEHPAVNHENFKFQKSFVHQGSNQGDFINFNSWVLENRTTRGNSALQMDIEGAEWEIISGMSEQVLTSFRFMVIEFHGMHQMAYQLAFQTIRSAFLKLLTTFEIVHVHANNAESFQLIHGFEVPPLVEITFVRKDLISKSTFKDQISHELDSVNVPGLPSVQLGELWQRRRTL